MKEFRWHKIHLPVFFILCFTVSVVPTIIFFFTLYSFQHSDLWNPFLRNFARFWLSFADNVTTETYSFVYLIVKMISFVRVRIKRDHTLSMYKRAAAAQRVFVGTMKYFWHILMGHKNFFKIFDGPWNIFYVLFS